MSGQVADVIDAMFERRVQRGEVVIRHGDDGDNFYVIDTGVYSVRVQAEGQEKTVSVRGTTGNRRDVETPGRIISVLLQ